MTSLLMVSARVFLIPLTYSKLRVYFDASSNSPVVDFVILSIFEQEGFQWWVITSNGGLSHSQIIIQFSSYHVRLHRLL